VKSLEEYLELAQQSHGHMCPGQVLGVRLAMLGLKNLGFEEPEKSAKRLITFVEVDRCATDAVALVTGCRLGKRTLKFFDFGKVAATFLDLETKRAVRIVARDDAREKARQMLPALGDAHRRQLEAYKVMDDTDLFRVEWVEVTLRSEDLPGRPRARVVCAKCGEGVNDGRERRVGAQVLCRSCAGEGYYKAVVSD
jgi:formylmethanofuran dehydrogenase subunit E